MFCLQRKHTITLLNCSFNFCKTSYWFCRLRQRYCKHWYVWYTNIVTEWRELLLKVRYYGVFVIAFMHYTIKWCCTIIWCVYHTINVLLMKQKVNNIQVYSTHSLSLGNDRLQASQYHDPSFSLRCFFRKCFFDFKCSLYIFNDVKRIVGQMSHLNCEQTTD